VPRYLITGDSGAGKSTVVETLAEMGYRAYNTDDMPDVTRLEDQAGEPVEWPGGAVDWTKYGWNWQEPALLRLLADGLEPVFVAAIASNQDSFYHLFDAIFVLVVDHVTLRHRLLSRTENDFGKDPDELAATLSYHADFERELLAVPRAVAIDATRPLPVVVDDILAYIRGA
jgi:hypothetical protein